MVAGIAAKVTAIRTGVAIKLTSTHVGFERGRVVGHLLSVIRKVRSALKDGPKLPSTVIIGSDISKGSQPSPARERARGTKNIQANPYANAKKRIIWRRRKHSSMPSAAESLM